jgi:hypothetical protein
MNVSASQVSKSPLTTRRARLSVEGRIAWHVSRAATDRLANLVAVARDAVQAADVAAARLAA